MKIAQVPCDLCVSTFEMRSTQKKKNFGYRHGGIKYVPFFTHRVFLKGLHDSKKKKNREISDLPQGTLGDPGISARLVIRHRPEGGCHGSIPNIHLISHIELPSLDPCGRLERWA